MKKTTYIEGLKLIYSDRVIDRSDGTRTRRGVDQANRQDQTEANLATAQAIIAEMEQVGRESLYHGYDERGLWRTPNPELIVQDTVSWELSRNAFILSAIVLVGLIWLVVHYTPQIDRWHL